MGLHVREKSVVLLSGGLDSSANLAFCRLRDEPVLALTVDYGQRAASSEIRAARALSSRFDVRHEVLELRWLGELGGSSLTDSAKPVPKMESSQLDNLEVARETAKSVWVPNRNGVLINVAAARAERLGASRVVVGFNAEEAATFPDNSGEFIARATRALELSTANQVKVACYTTEWDKTKIVAELRRQVPEFPFDLVWSCYHAGDRPCGECESCRRMARALK
jgi:7-cyano-7-deazaguanine synthase